MVCKGSAYTCMSTQDEKVQGVCVSGSSPEKEKGNSRLLSIILLKYIHAHTHTI